MFVDSEYENNPARCFTVLPPCLSCYHHLCFLHTFSQINSFSLTVLSDRCVSYLAVAVLWHFHFCCCDEHHEQEQPEEKEAYFLLKFLQFIMKTTRGRNSKQEHEGIDGSKGQKAMFFTSLFSGMTFDYFSYTSTDLLPRDGNPHIFLWPPTIIIYQENSL